MINSHSWLFYKQCHHGLSFFAQCWLRLLVVLMFIADSCFIATEGPKLFSEGGPEQKLTGARWSQRPKEETSTRRFLFCLPWCCDCVSSQHYWEWIIIQEPHQQRKLTRYCRQCKRHGKCDCWMMVCIFDMKWMPFVKNEYIERGALSLWLSICAGHVMIMLVDSWNDSAEILAQLQICLHIFSSS